MLRILITGGAGFIGSHTADALIQQGHQVRVLDLLDPQVHPMDVERPVYLHPEIELFRGDVRQASDVAAALEGIDVVYHFAALTGVGQSMYDLRSYVDTNTTGTATLLEGIIKRKSPLQKLVVSSSRAVYGEGTGSCQTCGVERFAGTRRRQDLEAGCWDVVCPVCGDALRPVPTRETRPLSPISVYGLTKRHQEDLCLQVSESFRIPTVCLRYFNVYGSRQSLKNPYTGVVSIFFSRIVAGQPIHLYEGGSAGRDFVHVSDVVRANLLALEDHVPSGSVINVGTGQRCTIGEVAGALGRATQRNPCLVDSGEYRMGDVRDCYADLQLARATLHYEPKVTLDQGMQEFSAWAVTQPSIDLYQHTVEELRQHDLLGASKKDG